MNNALYGLVLALQFLTRIPLPIVCPWNAATCRWALRCYPLVGLLIGALLAGLAMLGQGLPKARPWHDHGATMVRPSRPLTPPNPPL